MWFIHVLISSVSVHVLYLIWIWKYDDPNTVSYMLRLQYLEIRNVYINIGIHLKFIPCFMVCLRLRFMMISDILCITNHLQYQSYTWTSHIHYVAPKASHNFIFSFMKNTWYLWLHCSGTVLRDFYNICSLLNLQLRGGMWYSRCDVSHNR